MLTRRHLLNLAMVLILAVFLFGLVRLFALRFDTGDVFPPYSSLRADPLGTAIFYESLAILPERTVRRHKRNLDHLESGKGATLFLLGAHGLYLSTREEQALDRFLREGGRLVLTFFPSFSNPTPTPSKTTPSPTATPKPTPAPEATPPLVALKKVAGDWQVQIESSRKTKSDEPARCAKGLALDPELSWHSGVYFTPKKGNWRTIYRQGQHPVMIERTFGKGSIVLAGDSYFLSNEALLVERHPALLAWLAGGNRHLIFEESHFGIHEELGVVSLLRKYRLGGLVLGFLALVSLWLWWNASSSLSSARRSDPAPAMVSGRDSFSGFVTLLRRGLAPADLTEICLAQWRKSQPAATAANSALADLALERNPIDAYNRLTEIIDPQKWKRTSNH